MRVVLALTPHSRCRLSSLVLKAPTYATSLLFFFVAHVTRCSKDDTTACEHYTI